MSPPFALFIKNQRRAVVSTQQIMALRFWDIYPCKFKWVSLRRRLAHHALHLHILTWFIWRIMRIAFVWVLLKSDWGHNEHYRMTAAVGCVWILYTSPDCVWSDKSQQGTHIAAETTFRLMPSNSPWDYSLIHVFIQSFEDENGPSQHQATLLV